MGILRDFGNYLWNKITGRDRIQALPGENEGETAMSKAERFREENRKLAQQIGANHISNGDDLITKILTSLKANSTIVNHKAVKDRLQTFVMGIFEQNNLDTIYWGIENIEEMIKVIKASGLVDGENIISLNDRKDVHYGIVIDPKNGSIELQTSNKGRISERQFIALNKSGNLSIKREKYIQGYVDNELAESVYVEYDNNGIEQKRDAMKWGLDKWNRRKLLSEHVITERHAVYPFIAEQSVVVSNGRECEDTKTKYKLLDLNTVDSLANLAQIDSGEDISFQGVPEIDEYYQQHRVTVEAMLKACGIGNENQEIR